MVTYVHASIKMKLNEETQNQNEQKRSASKIQDSMKFESKNQISTVKKKIEKLTQCNICNKKFAGWQNFKSHIRMVHEKLKAAQCDLCKMTTINSFYYKR